MEAITFRNEQPEPTKPGIYYCKAPLSLRYDMLVRRVDYHGDFWGLSVKGDDGINPLHIYRWFGSITECREG